jgi:hypothetical protein
MNKGGFSWKRLVGITKVKQKISHTTGVPLTKSGRQRKIGGILTGGKGCLVIIATVLLLACLSIFAIRQAYSDGRTVENKRGCCSHHDGVCGCKNGRQVCCDGTLSPSCTC